MTRLRLILRSLCHQKLLNLGVVLGAALATAVLIGALVVGDSVRHTLRHAALQRLGRVHLALDAGDRFFTQKLADDVAKDWNGPSVSLLQFSGNAAARGGQIEAAGVRILGVSDNFWHLTDGPAVDSPLPAGPDAVVLSRTLARRLEAQVGDPVVLRLPKPSALPRDIPLGADAEQFIAMSLICRAIVPDDRMGRFSLRNTQIPPLNAFVHLSALQETARTGPRCNLLLLGVGPAASAPAAEQADAVFRRYFRPADADLKVIQPEGLPLIELRSGRVFLDEPVERAAQSIPGARPRLTYFVNELRGQSGNAIPYSMVTASAPGSGGELPEDFPDTGILLSQWAADDLKAGPGDQVTLSYFSVGEDRVLKELSETFTVQGILPTAGAGLDRHLMPDFPGLADVDSSRDWEPGIPLDLKKIRDQDEDYWKNYRGAPKAMVSLNWAEKTWSNRFGRRTAIRWDAQEHSVESVEKALGDSIDPGSLGLKFRDVRTEALAAAATGTDFSGLFLGLSFFVITAALSLMGLLLAFGAQQRAAQSGLLLAIGWPGGAVRRLWMQTGFILALLGAVPGVFCGAGYARVILLGLNRQWSGAVSGTEILFALNAQTLLMGAGAGLLAAVCAMIWVLRGHGRLSARMLLASRLGAEEPDSVSAKWGWVQSVLAALMLAGAAAIAWFGSGQSGEAAAGAFFGAGFLLLISLLLAGCRLLLRRSGKTATGLSAFGFRSAGRRAGRSMTTAGVLAAGVFLVVAVSAFHKEAGSEAGKRDSGSGGFRLFVQTAAGVFDPVTTSAGREKLGLDKPVFEGVEFVPMLRRQGDEASCLNLNRPVAPPLLGVNAEAMARRGAFSFSAPAGTAETIWRSLKEPGSDGTVPALIDQEVAMWVLHVGLGDRIAYTDEYGRLFDLRIAGFLHGSILQGYLVIDEGAFLKKFPSTGGAGVFLVEGGAASDEELIGALHRAWRDLGAEAMTTIERLNLFNTVQNTYLSIFSALGALGLLIGAVGLGLVVLRNVLERRGELAMMRAIGFSRSRLLKLILVEHGTILLLGLGMGVLAALVATAPAIRDSAGSLPLQNTGLLLAGLLGSGLMWTVLAARAALRGNLLEAIRSE